MSLKILEKAWADKWKTLFPRYTMFTLDNGDRKLLKYILTNIGEDKAVALIEYYLNNWDDLREQFNVKDILPTVRVLYYQRQQIVGLLEYQS